MERGDLEYVEGDFSTETLKTSGGTSPPILRPKIIMCWPVELSPQGHSNLCWRRREGGKRRWNTRGGGGGGRGERRRGLEVHPAKEISGEKGAAVNTTVARRVYSHDSLFLFQTRVTSYL